MATDDGRRRPYPRWLWAMLVALQALGVAGGLVLGVITYDARSQPEAPVAPTTVPPPVTEAPVQTLG